MEQSAPLEKGADLSEQYLNQRGSNGSEKESKRQPSARRQGRGAKASYNSLRGRYTRAVAHAAHGSKLALDATLRAAATINPAKGSAPKYSAEALRYKRFKRKTGSLFIFAVDTSGSMATNRIRQAKGALLQLLERSYIRRDHVALISFRVDSAEIALPPCRSVSRARPRLDELSVCGATPQASGLQASLRLARRARLTGARRIVLFLFTDGRANAPLKIGIMEKKIRQQVIRAELEQLGAALTEAKVETPVVDTQNRFTSRGEGRELAATLRGRYIFLPVTGADASASLFSVSTNQ
jgi:magnesium chelatase subunit D